MLFLFVLFGILMGSIVAGYIAGVITNICEYNKVFSSLIWPWSYWLGPKFRAQQVLKQAKREEALRIPSPTEVVQGVIGQAAIRHFNNWKRGVPTQYSGDNYQHNFEHKQIKVKRYQYTVSSSPRWAVSFGAEEVDVSESLKNDLQKSYKLFSQNETQKAHYKKEQRLLNTLEEYLK